jgi:hypothetical protein
MKRLTRQVVVPSPDKVASIHERVPLYKIVKAWDDNNPNLSEVYKLQRNNPQNKSHIEIHKDNGKYGIEFTINKMISEFNKRAEKCDRNWSDSFVEFENVLQSYRKQPGNRCFTSTFQSLLMQRCQCWLCKIVAWKKTSIEQLSSSFSGR